MIIIQDFARLKVINGVFPKKEFRAILENEGIPVDNSSKHANQLRVFGVKYEVVYE
jgi:hypothetical protein